MKIKKYNRTDEIDAIVEIINKNSEYRENSENGLVILLNGSWGSGKTTFLKDLENQIKQIDEFDLFLNYNSYSYDFYENAYLPLFACIEDKLKLGENFERLIKSTNKNTLNGLLCISYSITKSIFKNKMGIDLDDIKNNMVDIQDEDYLKRFKDFKKCKESIKGKLLNYKKTRKKIIIIDELDRCKPDFAMATLEIVKHFFDVKNYIFIIALDKLQLQESAKTIFGQGMDSEKYFSKFFDYQFNLPPLNFCDIIDTSEIDDFEEIVKRSTSIFNYLQVSSRDSKKIFVDFINKSKRFSNENKWTAEQSLFVIFLLTLKYVDLLFYNELINGNYTRFINRITNNYSPMSNNYSKLLNVGIGDEKNFKYVCDCLSSELNTKYIELNLMYVSTYPLKDKLAREKSVARELSKYIPQVKKDITYKQTIELLVN